MSSLVNFYYSWIHSFRLFVDIQHPQSYQQLNLSLPLLTIKWEPLPVLNFSRIHLVCYLTPTNRSLFIFKGFYLSVISTSFQTVFSINGFVMDFTTLPILMMKEESFSLVSHLNSFLYPPSVIFSHTFRPALDGVQSISTWVSNQWGRSVHLQVSCALSQWILLVLVGEEQLE